MSHFSRRARKKTLTITDHSDILSSMPGKITEKIILGVTILKSILKDNAVISHSQHMFCEGKLCSTNLIFFYDKISLVDQEKPINVIFLDFSESFSNVSHSILLEKNA